jgi:Fe-S-cluster-containing dehydrogenase component
MDRRDFLKVATAAPLLATVGAATDAEARHNLPPLPEGVGLLFDSNLCVGCQSCVAKCQEVNQMDLNPADSLHSKNNYLSPFTFNVIQVWENGTGVNKDQVDDGYAYIKRQCMHCVDPNCVSACPVSAMQKDPVTGIVTTDPSLCTGCRYCMVACPFNVPKYEYDDPFGRLQKCSLCNQKGVERIDKGGIPACAEVCPTGAVIFGKRSDLLREARQRVAADPGSEHNYPLKAIGSGEFNKTSIPHYNQEIYGEREGGGCQCLVLSSVPYEDLGLPTLQEESFGAATETVQHGLYRGMFLPIALIPALLYGWLTKRTWSSLSSGKAGNKHDEKEAGNE